MAKRKAIKYSIKLHTTSFTSSTTLQLFNSLFSRTICISQYQKGRTILDFNETRDDGAAVASVGPYAHHLQTAPDK